MNGLWLFEHVWSQEHQIICIEQPLELYKHAGPPSHCHAWTTSNCAAIQLSPMLKILPIVLSGISQNFHLLCSSVYMAYYAPRLATFLTIIWEHHFN